MWWKRSVGMYGWSGSDMMVNVLVGVMIGLLVIGALYGIYMAIWGVYDEFY
tara:strand:+ start:487 stop:639 length:153 start_codon:yes stop_codon:yes gene_type:complete